MSRGTTGVLAAVAVLAGASAGWAAAGSEGSTLTACQGVNGGFLRLVEAPQDCQAVERRVTWDRTGVAGPAGPAGPAGETGPAGAAAEHLAVRLAATGSLIQAPSGTTSSHPSGGRYEITFSRDVASCVAVASTPSSYVTAVSTQGRSVNVYVTQSAYYYGQQPVDSEVSLAVLC